MTKGIFWLLFGAMARPKKDPALLRDEILRIPVSADEKRRIQTAVLATDREFAGWARAILLKAADEAGIIQPENTAPAKKGRKNKELSSATAQH